MLTGKREDSNEGHADENEPRDHPNKHKKR
jgi:hypothetical protein